MHRRVRLCRTEGNRIARLSLLALPLLLAALARADEPEPPRKPRVYRTPQACFDALIAAQGKNDTRTLLEALSPGALKHEAASRVRRALDDAGRSAGSAKERREKAARGKAIAAVLDKHGLTEEEARKVALARVPKGQLGKGKDPLVAVVKDHLAFCLELDAAERKVFPQRFATTERPRESKARLADVKIVGNKATADLVSGVGKEEQRGKLEFRKVGDGWRINPFPNAFDLDR